MIDRTRQAPRRDNPTRLDWVIKLICRLIVPEATAIAYYSQGLLEREDCGGQGPSLLEIEGGDRIIEHLVIYPKK